MPQSSSPITTQNPLCHTGSVQVQRNLEISIPSPDSDRGMAIRCADWKRLEKNLAYVSNPPKDYSALYSALLGFSGSAWLSLIPFAITKNLPAWVMPSSIALAATSLFCGIFVVVLGRDQRKTRKTMLTALLDDVTEIGSRFAIGPTPDRQIIDASENKLPQNSE